MKGAGDLHQAHIKKQHTCHLPASIHIQVPDRLYRHQQNKNVTYSVEKPTGIEQTRDLYARPSNGLVPYSLPRRTLPDLGSRGGNIEQADNQHEETNGNIKRAPSLR